MKTFFIFPKNGEKIRLRATSMKTTPNSLRFFREKCLIAIFKFSEVKQAGEASLFREKKPRFGGRLSVKELNDWAAALPKS